MPFSVPANRFLPDTANEKIELFSGNPELTFCQFTPLFVDRKTPLCVPANRFSPKTARVKIVVSVNPELTAFQYLPLFVERYTPLPKFRRIYLIPRCYYAKAQKNLQ